MPCRGNGSCSRMEQKTILIVDDEPGALGLCSRSLDKAGYHVLTASSGNLALYVSRTTKKPDVALIDMVMPAMDGPTLAAQLEELNPNVVILLMSGFPRCDLPRLLGRELPKQWRFIEKPFTPATLIQAVQAEMEPQTINQKTSVPG